MAREKLQGDGSGSVRRRGLRAAAQFISLGTGQDRGNMGKHDGPYGERTKDVG